MEKSQANEKYLEMQILTQEIKQLRQQILNLENQTMELESLEDNLDEMKKVRKGAEILVPLGGGIFSKAELKDNEKVVMNVGASVMVKKSLDEAKEVVKNQIAQMKNLIEEIANELEKLAIRAQYVQEEIQGLMESKTASPHK